MSLVLSGAMILYSSDPRLALSDFRVYWVASQDVYLGRPIHAGAGQPTFAAGYPYPPVLAVLGSPLTLLPCGGPQRQYLLACLAGNLWNLFQSVLLVVAVVLLTRIVRGWSRRSGLSAFSAVGLFFPVYYELGLGQVDICSCCAWSW